MESQIKKLELQISVTKNSIKEEISNIPYNIETILENQIVIMEFLLELNKNK